MELPGNAQRRLPARIPGAWREFTGAPGIRSDREMYLACNRRPVMPKDLDQARIDRMRVTNCPLVIQYAPDRRIDRFPVGSRVLAQSSCSALTG